MLLSLFAAADAAAAASGSPIEAIQRKFDILPSYLIMQVVSFGILAFVLYQFALRKVLATMDERNQRIEEGLRYAKDMEAKLTASQNEAAERLRQASIEANKIVAEARTIAKDIETRAQAESQRRTEEMIAKATQAIELDRQKVMSEARIEITRLVVATTEKVLRRELSEADKARYNTSAAQELAGV